MAIIDQKTGRRILLDVRTGKPMTHDWKKYEAAPRYQAPKQAPIVLPKKKRPEFTYYWAYGSNLCHEAMASRCPAAKPDGPLIVPSARLVFRGVADVTYNEDFSVQGGLWKISEACERELDRYEGVASKFYLKRYLKIRIDGTIQRVLFYQMRRSTGVMPPSEYYLQTIVKGYEDFGLDISCLDDALRHSWSDKEVDQGLRERYKRKGSPKLARLQFEDWADEGTDA